MNTTLGYTSEIFNVPSSYGVGKEAEEATLAIFDVQQEILTSVSIGKSKREAEENLYRVFGDTCKSDWDGYGAKAVTYETYLKATDFLGRFPMNFPAPEISVDPDGDFSFEWHASKRRGFSVSLGANGELVYAGIYGAGKTHGVETFHNEIPRNILENVLRVYRKF